MALADYVRATPDKAAYFHAKSGMALPFTQLQSGPPRASQTSLSTGDRETALLLDNGPAPTTGWPFGELATSPVGDFASRLPLALKLFGNRAAKGTRKDIIIR